MKKIIKTLSLVLALTFVLVCFAGCGGEKSNIATTSCDKVKVIDIPLSEEEYAFCVAQDDTEFLGKVNDFLKKINEDGTFDKICNNYFGDGTPLKFKSAELDTSKDQLVVATATGFEPFEAVDNGEFYGIDLEIAYYLGQELGLDVVIQDMDFDAVVNSVQTGTCDIGMSGLSVTPERQKVVTFTDSYYNASQIIVVNENNNIFDECKTADDVVKILDTFTSSDLIGCQSGTTGELYIKGDKDYGFKGLKAEASPYKIAALAIAAMQQGKSACVVVDNGPAKAISAKINEQ